jgi:hypothetical protein
MRAGRASPAPLETQIKGMLSATTNEELLTMWAKEASRRAMVRNRRFAVTIWLGCPVAMDSSIRCIACARSSGRDRFRPDALGMSVQL